MRGTALPVVRGAGVWKLAQGLVVVGLLGLLAGLVLIPGRALSFLWFGFIPLVPALLLVSPGVWRNVCPLATLNVATGRRWGRRALLNGRLRWMGAAGAALLLVLIPARKLWLESHGSTLFVILVALGAVALLLGLFFEAKAGFCNAFCPILPVERLYGQRPFYHPPNVRCDPCTMCTRGGCMDLSPEKSVPQTLGPARRSRRWLREPFGVFALAFPGVILGYFTVPEAALGSVTGVYGHIALGGLLGYGAGLLAVTALGLEAERAVGLFGALAITLYYWLGSPGIAAEWGWPAWTVVLIRVAALALIAAWLFRFLRVESGAGAESYRGSRVNRSAAAS